MPIDLYKKLLENLNTVVLVLDQNLRITYLNPSAEHLFATSTTQLINTAIGDIFVEDKSSRDDLINALSNKQAYTRREARLHIPHIAQTSTVDYTITPTTDANNHPCLLMEISTLDRLIKISREDNLINTHMAAKALVRGVAHEIKNPLGGIRGAAQLLLKELTAPDLQDYTHVIIAEADRLRNLADRMLGSHKPPSFSDTNIHEILERVRHILLAEGEHRINIIRDYDPSLPEFRADKDQLIQAILNVVKNSMQALTENRVQKNPTIKLRTRALRQFTIGNTKHRLSCALEIEDNGPGIDKPLIETIFYPMVSGRASGTGLGLSISQSIIAQHQGLIECETAPGKTVFRLILPLNKPESQA
jgi:two-component system nitrogen regulation sensor histidine kinase GlnL